MDGFFVAKIKVGKRSKKVAAEEEDEGVFGATEDGETASASVFDAPEDEVLMAESKRKDLLKRKGIKIKSSVSKVEAKAPVKPAKAKLGKKMTEQRRPKKA